MRTPATVLMAGRKRAAAGRERQPSTLTGMRSPSSSIRRIQSWPPSPSHVIRTKSFAAGVRRFGDDDLTLDLRADLRGGIALCWRSSCVGGYRPVRSTARNSTLVRLLVERERPAPVPLSASACLSLRKRRARGTSSATSKICRIVATVGKWMAADCRRWAINNMRSARDGEDPRRAGSR